MTTQKNLKLPVARINGEPAYLHRQQERDLNFPVRTIPPEKLFADLLKRQARQVMADLTECPPDTIPAHLSRLMALREIFEHVLRHDFKETREANYSGTQLNHPSTLADFLACLDITRQTHRAPARDNPLVHCDRRSFANDVLCDLAGIIENQWRGLGYSMEAQS